MNKVLFCYAIFLQGCWMAPSPKSYVTQGVRVLDQAEVGQQRVREAIKVTLQALGAKPGHILGTYIHIYKTPICIPFEDKLIITDGITVGSAVQVSTVQGCFDSLAHELGHVVQRNRDGIIDWDHEDYEFWSTIKQVEQWIRSTYCEKTYKPMTPEEAAEACK